MIMSGYKKMNLIVAEVYRDGLHLITGNSKEIKEELNITAKTLNNAIMRGKAVKEKGLEPSKGSLYAFKIGKEVDIIGTDPSGLFANKHIKGETKEQQRLRRRIQRDMIREKFYNGNY